MSTLLSRLEVAKFADELGIAEESLAFLAEASPEQLRELRHLVTHARYARHERRLSRLASLTKIAPTPLAAKIAEHALGAEVSARVATLVDAGEAGKLTRHLHPEFLTDVSVSLDPDRSAAVITSLPEKLIVDVGRRLLARGEHLVLARFVAIYPVSIALQVLENATPDERLTLGIFAENHQALDAIVAEFSDEQVTEIIAAADASARHDDAIAMLSFVGDTTRKRFLAVITGLPKAERERFTKLAKELGYADLLA